MILGINLWILGLSFDSTHVSVDGFLAEPVMIVTSRQSLATSHDLGPRNVAFWKGNHLMSGKSRLVIRYLGQITLH